LLKLSVPSLLDVELQEQEGVLDLWVYRSLRRDCWLFAKLVLLFCSTKANFARDIANNISLHRPSVAIIALVTFRPQDFVSRFSDQLDGDDRAIPGTLDRALEDRIDVKQPGNLWERLAGISERLCSGVRNDA